MKSGYEAVIGLEIHVQLKTRSKMFCACRNEVGGEPNAHTCPVCLGLPGSLPSINREAIRMAIALGLAVEARVSETSTFYRKQYFYADLPKGYQITQGPVAVVEEGLIEIPGDPVVRGSAGPISVRIERGHLEEDAGKSHHEWGEEASHVDLNRAGVPLLEIVGGPDLRSSQEAYDYLRAMHRLVTFLGICDGNLEEGSFRCDANISVRPEGTDALGTRVEVKNLNSFRNVKLALDHEIVRQVGRLEAGDAIPQETRGWDAATGGTRPQRSKEAAMDYRFFPEPDLPSLVIPAEEVALVATTLPELPRARHRRFQQTLGLTDYEAGMLLQSPAFAAYFEVVAEASRNPKQACNWMLGEVSRVLNETGRGIGELNLDPHHLAQLIGLVEGQVLNLNTAKDTVFAALLRQEGTPAEIVERHGLGQVSDAGAIQFLVQEVMAAHPAQVAEVRSGNEKLRGFLVGQIMKIGKGKVNPKMVHEALQGALDSDKGTA